MWILRAFCRLILVGLLMTAVGAVAVYGSWKLLHPFILQREQGREIAQLEQRVDGLKREHARLKEAVDRLGTPQGRAEELRRMGYVRPKERIIRFLQGSPAQEAAPSQPTKPPENVGVKNRIKGWLERRFAPPKTG